MNKVLVIAEKPSVAKSISDVLGAKTRRDGSYEGNGYVVSWCIGHLLELAEPAAYDDKYAKWRYADLPIIPKKWKYVPNEKTAKQLKVLSELMKRTDIGVIVNACDAGREGELIFRLVYEHCSCVKPIQRLWISSMEESAIADGFRNLRPGADYESLYHAAKCRQQADWLVGMNYSRLYSVLYNARLNVGRVQTPTLAMIVERERKIKDFVKEPFYVVELTGAGFKAEHEKSKDKEAAERLRAACNGKSAVIKSVQRQEKTAAPPKLYDLTGLQREANRLFGYTAAQVLECAQILYENKLITYPRVDSCYLTEDMSGSLPALVMDVAAALPFETGALSINPEQVINNAKVTDHQAIIPTPTMSRTKFTSLPTAEKNILLMVSARLISAVSDRHVYAETVVTTECGGEIFTSKGKTVVRNGWKAIEQAFLESVGKTVKDADKPLPLVYEGVSFTADANVREGFSQPPSHFTEDLLLSAMETAGAEDMPDDVERKGLGTPATRASVIESLIKSGLLTRKDKQLLPTEKGINLIRILPDAVKSPLLTAEWENHMSRVKSGELTAADFMISISAFITDTVKTNNSAPDEYKALFPSDKPKGECIGRCPRCGGNINEAPKGYFCDNESCKFALWKDNRLFTSQKKTLTKEIAKTLLAEGRIFMSGLVSQKTGKPYNATIILEDKGDGYPSFVMEFEKKAESGKK